MKALKLAVLLAFGLLSSLRAQEARFFRLLAPVATTLTALTPDGYVTWTNAATNATFTVQVAPTLTGPSNWLDYLQVPVTNPATTLRLFDLNPPAGLTLIPAGSFTMGATTNMGHESYSDEVPQHTVSVSAFYMDKTEVSRELWLEVYTWALTNGYTFDNAGSFKNTTHPVHTVNWFDCVKWCNARSQKEGLAPCYYTTASQTTIYTNGQINLTNACVNWTANGYRLPTEAEWEKAARAGLSGKRFPWGDTISHSQANYYVRQTSGTNYYVYDISPTESYHPTFTTNPMPYTSPVGYFAANGYGLYDMAGNVSEWCWDWYASGWYWNAGARQTDTRGPASGSARLLRGGGWNVNAFYARCAIRLGDYPENSFNYVGFRCVRGL